MSSTRVRAIFFELFSGLPRQGPGDSKSTVRAFRCVPELTPHDRILDIGCGTGAQTFALAESTPASIVAIDNHVPYVEALNERAVELSIANRVVACVADMRQLEFENDSFDLIWCEGAIYNMGVDTALREWRRFLRHKGFIVFTEVCWQKPNPPNECRLFWKHEYPAISAKKELLNVIESCGYQLIDHFPLDESAWWDGYYQPLQTNLNAFRESYGGDPEAQNLCDQCQREIDIWHAYGAFYGYEFVVIQAV